MLRKTITLTCFAFFSIVAIAQKKSDAIGGKKDRHGCIKAAGYQWSEINQSCIRPFELPVQLLDASRKSSASFILEKEGKMAEVFCKEGHFMLTINQDGSFGFQKRKKVVNLFKLDNLWTLKCNDVVYTGYLD